MAKAGYNKKDLKEFQKILEEKREVILKEIHERAEEVYAKAVDTGDLADLATDLLERELNLSLTEAEKSTLKEIDEALDRIENGDYGICVDTGNTIPKERLKAMPTAKRTATAQEKFDKIARDRKKRLGY